MDEVDEVLKRIEQEKVEPELPDGIMALELLQLAYRGKIKLTPQQLMAAREAVAYETSKPPKTQITMNGQTFAEALDRCIERSGVKPVPLPPPKVIEHEPPVTPAEMKRPFTQYRRRFI
jgi:hypothetical protein